MNVWGSTILSILLALSASSAFAVKMDETTHDQVIRRLELGVESLDKADPARTGVLIRLADLYADRARLKAMNEMQAGCTEKCPGSLKDRERSIQLYNEALPSVDKAQQGRTLLQIAHLYALNDQAKKSTDLYKKILNSKRSAYASEVRALANSSMGEIHFRKGDFKTALKYFESARRENLKNKALVEYRLAWCQLNLGFTEKATKTLINLLKNPEMLSTQTTDGKTVDLTFVEDVSNDLAKFIARGAKVGSREIALLRSLSPDKKRKDNLHTLASETDRLGKKHASLIVWAAYVDEGDVSANEKLEVQTRVAKIFYDMGKLDLAANAYEKALDLWKKEPCSGDADKCNDLKSRLRGLVTAWNKSQKQKPTAALFRAYVAFTNVFQDDTEMLHWGAIVGRSVGKHQESAVLFHRAAAHAAAELQKKPGDKTLSNILEGSLLGEIEMAEASKDLKARETAYNWYLQMNPNGTQAFQVRYQRAQVYYQANRYQEAFSEFHFIASQPSKEHHDIQVKAADLALDCLVAMHDDQSLQVRSLEYARVYPERKTEYLKISRKATMNIVATNLKKERDADKTDYKASLVALNGVNMDGAEDAEKIKFYKNKIVIAQKAMDLDAVNSAANSLLMVKSLGKDDREYAMTQKVWVAELQLNFSLAYRLTQDMQLSNMSKADRELRLALLAELAGLNANKHYEAYLRIKPSGRAANLVRITLIKNSNRPWKELEKHQKYLKTTPDLFAGIALEVFARQKDLNKSERLLKTTNIGKYAAGQTIARHLALRDFRKFDAKIRSHRIYGYSDAATKKTLKERLKLLGQSERQAQLAFRKHDWTLQVLSLDLLARENRRLYRDIGGLPIPKRLSAADKIRYRQLLKQQSQPYLARAEKIENELSDIWSNSNSVQNLQTAYITATPDLQKLYRDEIQPLALNAPSGAKNRLLNLLNTPYKRPSQKDILLARRELQANPFDISKAEQLRALEAQNGKPSMVVYLDERIGQMKKGRNL
jgi:tetratricopeptide (TPR) repeat protein